ncbi:hypothetical protein KSP40_PGU010227 [Platanthera guangdongensis]|uniref:Uncharacterized protein n=1 Tax=Platanthera guangdongensis TaxID=2320717 RepID=A0ABR2LH45_9ASPA
MKLLGGIWRRGQCLKGWGRPKIWRPQLHSWHPMMLPTSQEKPLWLPEVRNLDSEDKILCSVLLLLYAYNILWQNKISCNIAYITPLWWDLFSDFFCTWLPFYLYWRLQLFHFM